MNEQKLNYELPLGVVNYILTALDKVQISWVQSAKDLLTVTELLQNPTNKDSMEEEQYNQLKAKFEKKKDK